MNPLESLRPSFPRRESSRSWREAFYLLLIFFSIGLAWQAWSERNLRPVRPRPEVPSAAELEFEYTGWNDVGRSVLVRVEPGSLVWVESRVGWWEPRLERRVVRAQPVLSPRGVVEIFDLREQEYIIRAQHSGGPLFGYTYDSKPGAPGEIDLRPQFRMSVSGAFLESADPSREQTELFGSRSVSLARGERGEIGIAANCSIRPDGERVTFGFSEVPSRAGEVFRLVDAANGRPFGPRIVAEGAEQDVGDFVVEFDSGSESKPQELPASSCGLEWADNGSMGPKTIRAFEDKSKPATSIAGTGIEIARIRTSASAAVTRSRCVVFDCYDAETGLPATEGRTRVRIVDRTERISNVIEFEVESAARFDVSELFPGRQRLSIAVDRDGFYPYEVSGELPGDDGLPVIMGFALHHPRIRPLSID